MIILDIVIVLASIYLIALTQSIFNNDVNETEKAIKKYKLDNNCKSYLNRVKSTQTASYSYMAATVSGLIFYVSYRLLQGSINMSTRQITFTTFYVWILVFATSYKTTNCLLARKVCPSDNCDIIYS